MADEKLIGHAYTERLTIDAAECRVRYRQELHLKNFYIMLHDLFIEEGWVKRVDADWPEHYFLVKEEARGTEMWIWWRFKKIPGDHPNTYYRFNLDIFWHVTGSKEIEVMKAGQKFKTTNSDLELVFTSKLEIDYKHEDGKGWRDHPVLKHFNEMMYKRIWKNNLERKRDELYRETYRIQEVVKKFLGMRLYMPEAEGQEYWPNLGSGDKEGLVNP